MQEVHIKYMQENIEIHFTVTKLSGKTPRFDPSNPSHQPPSCFFTSKITSPFLIVSSSSA